MSLKTDNFSQKTTKPSNNNFMGINNLVDNKFTKINKLVDLPTNNLTQMIQKITANSSLWTILIYLDGDNNLEQAAINDFNEMESVEIPLSLNIIVQFDRIPGYDTTNGDWTGTRTYKIIHDNNTLTIGSTLLQDLGELDMGDPLTLQKFMQWGLTAYPADHYALIIWDHGGGVDGIAWDNSNNNNHLTLEELSLTFEKVFLSSTKSIIFDIIGLDACLMATIEVTNQIKDYAKYIIASEEVEPSDGWPYDRILSKLSINPSMDGQQLATIIVSEYGVDYDSRYTFYTTLSAVKSDHIQSIVNGLDFLANQLKVIVEDEKSGDTFLRTRLIEKAFKDAQKFQLENQIDLGGFLKSLKDSNEFNTIFISYLLNNYTFTILENYFGTERSGSTGLTIHTNPNNYPAGIKMVRNTHWDEFLSSFESSLASANNINYIPIIVSNGIDLTGNFTDINPKFPIVNNISIVSFFVYNVGTITSQTYKVSFSEFKEGEKESVILLITKVYNSLNAQDQRIDTFNWSPTIPGERSLLMFIETVNDINEGNNLNTIKNWVKPIVGSPAAFIWLNRTDEYLVEKGLYGGDGRIYYEVDNLGIETIPATELRIIIKAVSIEYNFTEIIDNFTYDSPFSSFTRFISSSDYIPSKGGIFNFYIIIDYSLDPIKTDDSASVSTYVYTLQTDLAINILNTEPASEGISSKVNIEVFNQGVTNPGASAAIYLFDYIYYNLTWVQADSRYLNALVTNTLDLGWYSKSTFNWEPQVGGLHLLLAWIVENATDSNIDNDPFDFNDISYFIIYVHPNAPDLSVEQFTIEKSNSYYVGTNYTLTIKIFNLGLLDAVNYQLLIYDHIFGSNTYFFIISNNDSISSFQFASYSASWTPKLAGSHILTIEALIAEDYVNVTNKAYISIYVGNALENSQSSSLSVTNTINTRTKNTVGFEFIILMLILSILTGIHKLKGIKK
jgi:hypothetical protein